MSISVIFHFPQFINKLIIIGKPIDRRIGICVNTLHIAILIVYRYKFIPFNNFVSECRVFAGSAVVV